jgi:hypothetical protein
MRQPGRSGRDPGAQRHRVALISWGQQQLLLYVLSVVLNGMV